MTRLTDMPRDVAGLVALFAASGIVHLVRPRVFEVIVPRALPRRRELVYVSGVMELACAGGLVHPASRRLAGLASAGLLAAVFPANVQMAVDARQRRGRVAQVLTLVRLPLQLPLIRIGWRAWRTG